MMNIATNKKLIALAKKYGFKLIRQKKHYIFRNDKGLQLVTAKSPSDVRALQNIEATIKRLLQNNDNSNHTS